MVAITKMQIMFFFREFDICFRIISLLGSHMLPFSRQRHSPAERSVRVVQNCQEMGIAGSVMSTQRREETGYKAATSAVNPGEERSIKCLLRLPSLSVHTCSLSLCWPVDMPIRAPKH